MKTLAELKRNANNGNMKLELVEWYGKIEDGIPERLHGIRKVKGANTVAIILINNNGVESELRLKCAKLVEYDGESLIVYNPGERDTNTEEKAILNELQRMEKEYYEQNPYGDFYWKKKAYFKDCSCPWMSGYETIKGKKYLYNGKVRDDSVKGEIILKYKVIFE